MRRARASWPAGLRPHLSFANVVSVMALFIALGGGAYAAVKLKANQVKSKHIAPNAAGGADVNEASLGTVPSAQSAANAANAANAASADSVAGFTPGDFQFGDGFDSAIAGFLDSGESGGIGLFEGAVGFTCQATPELIYEDEGGDLGAVTDLWLGGAHEAVADGGAATPLAVDPDSTTPVQLWGGADTNAKVMASVHWDGGETECVLAISAQENLNAISARSSAAGRSPGRGRSRDGLPPGWVEPAPKQ